MGATIWLGNMLRATTACTVSTSQLPTVIRPWCVLCFVISRCASRHSGVQLVISHRPRCLRTRRISEPTCRPSGVTNHWIKKMVRCDFPTFSRTWIFFLLALSLLWSSLFCSSLLWLFAPLFFFFVPILPEVWLRIVFYMNDLARFFSALMTNDDSPAHHRTCWHDLVADDQRSIIKWQVHYFWIIHFPFESLYVTGCL